MAHKQVWFKILSLLNSFALLIQLAAPIFFYPISPVFAADSNTAKLEYVARDNAFDLTIFSSDPVSYTLSYIYGDNQTDGVTGSGQQSPFFRKTINAGTCSTDDCVNHRVKSGTLEWSTGNESGTLVFTINNGKLVEVEPDPTPTPAPMSTLSSIPQTTPITVNSDKCMEDLYGSKLNCTANDVSIADVTDIAIQDDGCQFVGDTVTFSAKWNVLSTATQRYNVGLYFASQGQSNALNGQCSISTLPNTPTPPWYDFDNNICGDISSSAPVNPVITMTVKCIDTDSDNKLNLPYCTSWEQNSTACSGPLNTIPGSPSKCNCDNGFEVPITVPYEASIEVIKDLIPNADPGKFNLLINNQVKKENVSDGGSTGKVVVGAGTSAAPGNSHTVAETAGDITSLSEYTSSITCVDRDQTTFNNGPALYIASTGPLTVPVDKDDDIICTITNSRNYGSLTVTKVVINDNGGTKVITDFPLFINNNQVTNGTANQLQPGTYTVSETNLPGYAASFSGDCDSNGVVTLAAGDNKTCTITNDDIAPTLQLTKYVNNGYGTNATPANWTLTATGTSGTFSDAGDSTTFHPVTAGVIYTLSESGPSEFQGGSWSCTSGKVGSNQVQLAPGQQVTCTITNDALPGNLIVKKELIKDNGATESYSDFYFTINNGNATPFDTDGQNEFTVDAGYYTVEENSKPGWTTTYDNCTNIYVPNGRSATCTITNNDQSGTLIVKKVLTQDNGGNEAVTDFTFSVNGDAEIAFESDGENVVTVPSGTYTITEPASAGYSTIYNNCSNVVIPNGGTATCTITNNDIAPSIQLTKNVINNNGGTADKDDFSLLIGSTSVVSHHQIAVNANQDYAINEVGLPGYQFYSISGNEKCPKVLGGTVRLNENEHISCTITNDDVAPTLKLVKEVTNNNGGSEDPGDWTLYATGTDLSFNDKGDSDQFHTVKAGVSYVLTESGPVGYSSSWWTCDGGLASENTVELEVGENVTCTITNDDIAPKLTVVKNVINNNGGNNVVADFNLYRNDVKVTSGTAYEVEANKLYLLTEDNVSGYQAGVWGGDCAADGTITLKPGDNKTCTITNDDIAPTITLYKETIIDDSSSLGSNEFGLSLDDMSVLSGQTVSVTANTPIRVNELGARGWSFVSITGDATCPAVLGGTLTLDEGEDVSCTITNTRDTGSIVVHKIIDEDGDLTTKNDQKPGAGWLFDVDGQDGDTTDAIASSTDDSGTVTFANLKTGRYTIIESRQDGYDLIGATCGVEVGNFDQIDSMDDVRVTGFDTTECTFYNSPNGNVHGFKWNDADGNAEFNEGEARLSGWNISIYRQTSETDFELVKSMVTDSSNDHFGWYWFEHLYPGNYKVCETNQTGWSQTYPNNEGDACHYLSLPDENRYNFRQSQNAVYAPDYNFGNQYVAPRLTIEKYNNRWPNILSSGDEIIYTIVLRAYDNIVYNLKVKDLLPLDVVYKAGSYQAHSNKHGLLAITPPTYASPGTWDLGTIESGEVITLTYIGTVKNNTDPGTYKDVAWAAGTIGANADTEPIMASSVATDQSSDPGNLSPTFVGTKILVDASPQTSEKVDVIEEEKRSRILGTTTLPATGSSLLWLLLSFGLIGAGSTGLWITTNGKKRGRHA